MVQVNFDLIHDQFFINYLNFLISKVYKILPIVETEPETIRDYLDSLILELKGSQQLMTKIKHDAKFISLLSTLQYFADNPCTHKVYKREVFKCIKIIQGLQDKYSIKDDIV